MAAIITNYVINKIIFSRVAKEQREQELLAASRLAASSTSIEAPLTPKTDGDSPDMSSSLGAADKNVTAATKEGSTDGPSSDGVIKNKSKTTLARRKSQRRKSMRRQDSVKDKNTTASTTTTAATKKQRRKSTRRSTIRQRERKTVQK